MSQGLSPMDQHFALLNAKDEVALDLLAALYAVHPDGDRIFAIMDKRKRSHTYGDLPQSDAMQAHAERDLDIFKRRVAEIRDLL